DPGDESIDLGNAEYREKGNDDRNTVDVITLLFRTVLPRTVLPRTVLPRTVLLIAIPLVDGVTTSAHCWPRSASSEVQATVREVRRRGPKQRYTVKCGGGAMAHHGGRSDSQHQALGSEHVSAFSRHRLPSIAGDECPRCYASDLPPMDHEVNITARYADA
ncbi:MAG: hypothetical protein WA880_05695, partial [Ornithinimicrobium sp.]